MANAEDAAINSQQQNDGEPEAVNVDGNKTGRNDSVYDKNSMKSTACERFSIRGYASAIRKLDINQSWPFPQHLLETRLKEAGNLALPSLEIPKYRWWNCQNCVRGITTSAESPIEKEYMTDTQVSVQAYDGNIDGEREIFETHFPASSAYQQEKQKENMLDHSTETVGTLTSDLKSDDAVGSLAYEIDKDEKDEEVAAGIMTEHGRTCDLKSGDAVGFLAYEIDKEEKDEEVVIGIMTEHGRTVPMVLEMDKSEIVYSEEKKIEISHCLSNSRNFKGTIIVAETHSHEQEEKGVCGEMEQSEMETTSSILVSETNEELDYEQNKSEELQIPCQASSSWEYFARNKNVFKMISEKMKKKEMEQAASPILAFDYFTNEINNISNDPVGITSGENLEGCQGAVGEEKGEKTISNVVESLTVQTLEFSIQNKDDFRLDSDDGNGVPCLNGSESSCPEQRVINKLTKGKECTDLSTSQPSLDKGNVLLSVTTGKLKVSESRSKRKPQKRRSIADIIASKTWHPKSSNKQTEESKSADIMEDNICRIDNNEQLPQKDHEQLPQRDHRKDPKGTVKMSAEPRTIESNDISEVNIHAAKNNAILKKLSSKKPKVMMKHHGIGVQSRNTHSTICAKSSSTPCLSEAGTNALQFTQGITHLASISRDKELQNNFLNLEYGQRRQEFPEMEDEIPMDIVELMAKNQHERGLSSPKNFHRNHDLQKDEKRLKRKKTDFCHVNKHVEEEATGLKQHNVTPNSKAQPKPTGEENLKASLRNHFSSDLLVDNGHIDVSRVSATDNSCISDKEGITSGSCKGHLAMLQLTQWFNPWDKYSPDFVAPLFDETNAACDRYGVFTTDTMALDSMWLQGSSTYSSYMEIQKLHREGTPALSYITDPVLPVFQNKSEPSLGYNGYSHQMLTNTDSPRNLPNENTDLGGSGSKFDLLSEHQKGNGIPNLSVRTDGGSRPLYFDGQSNSALLQQVNSQETQTFGKKNCLPSAPLLRLMGQSVPVPANCGNKSMATENSDNRNFSNLPQGSSQNHVSWFHPATCTSSGVMERHRGETFTGTERVFTGSSSIQDSACMNKQIISSVKTIPPVPKFRDSVNHVSNGYSGTSIPSCAVPGKAGVTLEPSILRTNSPFHGTGTRTKKGLPWTNGDKGNLQTFSTVPPASQSTRVVKSSSFTKGFRSYRRTPTNMHLNRGQRSTMDIYPQSGHQYLQSPWVLESKPKQNLTDIAKAKDLRLSKELEESALCGKKACDVEICKLNQNPAELIIDNEEHGYSLGYEHLASSRRALSHSERNRNMAIPQGQKRPRSFKKKHLREFLCQKDAVGDPTSTNVDILDSVG